MKDICEHTYIVISFRTKKNMAGFLCVHIWVAFAIKRV
jgi:hypothetical protein